MAKYKCKDCEWIGSDGDMRQDSYFTTDNVEIFSDHICPNCKQWNDLKDYTLVKTLKPKR